MNKILGDISSSGSEVQTGSAERGEVNNREVEIILQELTRGPHELIPGTAESASTRFVLAQHAAVKAAVKDLTMSPVPIESVAEKRDLIVRLAMQVGDPAEAEARGFLEAVGFGTIEPFDGLHDWVSGVEGLRKVTAVKQGNATTLTNRPEEVFLKLNTSLDRARRAGGDAEEVGQVAAVNRATRELIYSLGYDSFGNLDALKLQESLGLTPPQVETILLQATITQNPDMVTLYLGRPCLSVVELKALALVGCVEQQNVVSLCKDTGLDVTAVNIESERGINSLAMVPTANDFTVKYGQT